ncbi:hypothetical protein Syun_001010 [Stephania yunnanensis]|uniref:Uncharacterized protein n=1 Tax=Stephania yunnanensis TaxID=152371 RepID=A0AAP0LFU1_9MAGN
MGSNEVAGSYEDSGQTANDVDDNDGVVGSDTTSAPAPKIGMVFDNPEDAKAFSNNMAKGLCGYLMFHGQFNRDVVLFPTAPATHLQFFLGSVKCSTSLLAMILRLTGTSTK